MNGGSETMLKNGSHKFYYILLYEIFKIKNKLFREWHKHNVV